jgi:hypothetical protein
MDLFETAVQGVVSASELDAVGVGSSRRRQLCREGTIKRLVRGWYAVPGPDGARPWTEGEAWERAECIHRLTTIALVRSFDGRAAASHYSALLLREIPTWLVDLDTVQLTRLGDDHSRHRSGAVIHPRTTGAAALTAEGVVTLPVAEAIVGTGLLGVGQRDPGILAMSALIAADHSLRTGACTEAELACELDRQGGHPGIITARAFLRHRDGRHESPGETRTAHVLRQLGYAFTPQVEVPLRGHSRLLDFLLDDYPVAVEFDGMVKYKGSGEEASTVVHQEKLRENEVRQTVECEFVRVTRPDLDRPRLFGQEIEAAIARAGRRRAA